MSHQHNTIGIPVVRAATHVQDQQVRRALDDLAQETTRWLQQLAQHIDTTIGFRGEPTFHANMNVKDNRITKVGIPKHDTDAQLKGLSLGRDALSDKAWDARGLPIINLPTGELPKGIKGDPGAAGTNALNETQIRAIIADEIREAVFGENDIFTAAGTGFTAAVTGTASYVLVGGVVVLFLPDLTGTSNSTAFTITGMPAAITPTRTSNHVVTITDTTTDVYGLLRLTASSTTITMLSSLQANGDFGNSGSKGLFATWISYGLF